MIAAAALGCALFDRGARPPFRKVLPPVAFEILRDSPEVPILDLRSPEEFHGPLGHLNRARNIPLEELAFRLVELSGFRDRTFLVYCRSGGCGAEGMAILASSGYTDAVLMDGGIEGWIRAGFGTVGAQPPSEPAAPAGDSPPG